MNTNTQNGFLFWIMTDYVLYIFHFRLPEFYNQNKIRVKRVSRIPIRAENSLAKKTLSDIGKLESASR